MALPVSTTSVEVANTMQADAGPASAPAPSAATPLGSAPTFASAAAPAASASSLQPLLRIGRFVTLGRLGQGGMGQVFSAYDPDLDRKVALKLVRDLSSSHVTAARVKQEAQAMAKVSHPNVVHVYEAGESEGRVFIVMEIVDGGSLAEWQARRDLAAPGEVFARLRVYLQAAAGLLAAHRCGLIHRDFKPDNVLVGKDGRVRVADFGLARVLAGVVDPALAEDRFPSPGSAADSGPRLTQAGAILGTPGYMSPEQVAGAEADERSDQFSFCAALYEALYGRRPFPTASFEAYARAVRAGQVRAPGPSAVPLVVERAILRGLSANPAARFPGMAELIAALQAGLGPESEPLLTRTDRFRLGVGIIAALCLIEITNTALVLVTGTRNSYARAIGIVVLFSVLTAALWRWPPWPIRHKDRYRRLMSFSLISLGCMVSWRVASLLMGLRVDDCFTMEVIGVGGLFLLQAQHVGWRHGVAGVLLLGYAPLVHLLPGLRVILYNLLLMGGVLSSVFVHMRQPGAAGPPPGGLDGADASP